jgi:glycosyltransferase involved in cell wall biosynthesis
VRILQINKFFWLSGGAESYMFDLSALLASHGHEVLHFSMADPRNRPSPQAEYFADHLDYRGIGLAGGFRRAGRILGGTIYSFESREKLRRLLRDLRPDVAHVHLIDHHLSPSVLHALRDESVPVVQTAHDYKLVCPNYQLYIPRTGEVCERCLSGNYYHCAIQRCLKNSLPGSTLAAGAKYFHRATQIFERNIHSFLYATDFVRTKLERGGMPAEKLRHVPLYIDLDRFRVPRTRGDYIVYAGRLAPEKGLATLLKTMHLLPEVTLRLVGDGPFRATLEAQARDLGLSNVEFTGFLSGDAYAQQLAGARLLVLSSECYETCGLVIWEANALGVPAVGARIGGIPESIVDGETGLLFKPGDPADLAEKIRSLLDDRERADAMGARGRDRVQANCTAHHDRILAAYNDAVKEAQA